VPFRHGEWLWLVVGDPSDFERTFVFWSRDR
jgi:hypothetical protein